MSPAHHIVICCLNPILSLSDFLVKLDKKDRGNTKAALPIRTSPRRIELTPIDVPGLLLTTRHFSMSKASIPTYRKIKISETKDNVAKVCFVVTLELSVTLCQV